jgi:hypothetical protein
VNQEPEIRALKSSNPECPTGADSSVNLVHGLNPSQVTTTSAADAPPVSTTRERRARGIKILSEELALGVEPAALDRRVAPDCPPGLAAKRRSSAIMIRQTRSARRRFRQRMASLRVLPSAIFVS